MYDKYTMKLQYFHFCIVIIANCIADGNTDAYKAATAISLALAIVTLLAMGFVIIIIYVRHKHTYSGTGEGICTIL